MSNPVNYLKIVRFPLATAVVVACVMLGPIWLGYILGFGWISFCLAYSYILRKKVRRPMPRHQRWSR